MTSSHNVDPESALNDFCQRRKEAPAADGQLDKAVLLERFPRLSSIIPSQWKTLRKILADLSVSCCDDIVNNVKEEDLIARGVPIVVARKLDLNGSAEEKGMKASICKTPYFALVTNVPVRNKTLCPHCGVEVFLDMIREHYESEHPNWRDLILERIRDRKLVDHRGARGPPGDTVPVSGIVRDPGLQAVCGDQAAPKVRWQSAEYNSIPEQCASSQVETTSQAAAAETSPRAQKLKRE